MQIARHKKRLVQRGFLNVRHKRQLQGCWPSNYFLIKDFFNLLSTYNYTGI